MRKDLIKKIHKCEWEQYWSGRWSFTTTSYFVYYYTHLMKKQMGEGFTKVVAISRNEHTTCFFEKSDRKRFGGHLVKRVLRDSTLVSQLCEDLKKRADHLLAHVKHLKRKAKINANDFTYFITKFYEYTGPHISPRHIIDFLPSKHRKKYFPSLKEVRLYTEKVYVETEELMQKWAKQISKETCYKPEHILCLTYEEINDFFNLATLPKENILESRYKESAIIYYNDVYDVITNKDVVIVEKLLLRIKDEATGVRGTVAYAGNAVGRVRIVLNPNKANVFSYGDILVTTMTRPEFLPLMKKAGGVITDLGGLLCHAAIVARELKKPTIIGTEKATKVLRDGDFVEVDANNGTVKILKRAQ